MDTATTSTIGITTRSKGPAIIPEIPIPPPRGPTNKTRPHQNSPHQLTPSMKIHNHSKQRSVHEVDSQHRPRGRTAHRYTEEYEQNISHHRSQPPRDGRDKGYYSPRPKHHALTRHQSPYSSSRGDYNDPTTTNENLSLSPEWENRRASKGKLPSRSLNKNNRLDYPTSCKTNKPREGARLDDHPQARGNARGNNDDVVARLQRQVDELSAKIKDIAPNAGPEKHRTLLPFSSRLRNEKMQRSFRMPKFVMFDGT
ncbi:hypothetical protein LIER_24704 [Lithospermum erythrorhizon]|uniref:Uncharacterized protein n=1 Tax=Lithospermum erythrorhizon TaxID=34254 RepID=A0AAV3R3B3_LITER